MNSGVTGPSRIPGSHAVTDRRGGNQKQDAEAFRRALEEHAGGGDQADRDARAAARRDAELAMRRELQRRRANGRRDEGEAHHVDVVA